MLRSFVSECPPDRGICSCTSAPKVREDKPMAREPLMVRDTIFWARQRTKRFAQTRVIGLREPSGQGIGSWLACHEFEPSLTKDLSSRKAVHVKSIENSTVLMLVWCGSWERRAAQVPSRHLTMVQNYVVRRQKPSCS
ncbi:hypothetical protein TNCV_4361111 [Trichonephila clavipes]|nr:hypothetical protein TNCV_4361111 [Trichonephila clavipes]